MIHARGLARTFRLRRGTVEAVAGVDIDVSAGEMVGFLGPNAAGKTTTLRMLTTLLKPSAGTATVAGHDLLADPVGVRRKIGYVGQGSGAGPDCLVADELQLQGRFYGLSPARARERAAELLDQLDLAGTATRVVRTLSGGQRRRLDIALGLMHLPSLVFLDEPSTGLDPQSRANLWGHIRNLRATRGTTVFLTTHYLDEADALCDRILVIDQGRIVAQGTPDELKRRVAGDLVLVGTGDPEPVAELMATVAGSTEHGVDGRTVRFRVPDGASVLPTLLRDLHAAGLAMTSVEVRRPSLDDVFLSITGRSLRDAEQLSGARRDPAH